MIGSGPELGAVNDARLLRLRHQLALGRGFQLVIVEAEPGPIRREVVRRILSWARRPEIGPLVERVLEPGQALEAQLAVDGGAVVSGLERTDPGPDGPRDWVAELNWAREQLPALVHGPMVLVVSQAVHRALFERAPDLYRWRRHAERIAIEDDALARPLRSPGDQGLISLRDHYQSLIVADTEPVDHVRHAIAVADVLLELDDEPDASRALDGCPPLGDEESGHRRLRAQLQVRRAACALARQDLAQADALIDGVEQDDDPGVTAHAALIRGYLNMASGEWDHARGALKRAMTAAVEACSPNTLLDALEAIAQTELARGEIDAARLAIDTLIRGLHRLREPSALRRLDRLAHAVLPAYPEEGIPLLDAALAIADDTGDRGMALWLPLQRAMVAQRLGNHAEVRSALAQTSARVRADDPVQLRAIVDATSAMLLAGELLASPDTPIDETVVDALVNTQDQLRRTHPQIAAMVQMWLGAVRRRAGQLALARTAYRQAETDARAANDLDRVAEAALEALEVEVERPSDAALDELRAIAGAARTTGHVSREAKARLILGRALLGRGARDMAVVELTRAQECFAACADDDGEAVATRWLDAARSGSTTRPEDQGETPHR
jgi:tetratricopeptide (TPR) repeat protein